MAAQVMETKSQAHEHPNQPFWDELCGTHMFQSLGLKEVNKETVKIFDEHYFKYYEYLKKDYIDVPSLKNKKVLEIGLGFGTVAGLLADNSKEYTGLDYSRGPVDMLNTRIGWLGKDQSSNAIQGSALKLPFDDNTFDYVVSIGCLHHTGDTEKCIQEVERVVKKGGQVLIMLYYSHGYKNILFPFYYIKNLVYNKKKISNAAEYFRSMYDKDMEGNAAPIVDRVSVGDCERLFKNFKQLKITKEIANAKLRNSILGGILKPIGHDLYITGTKQL
jgi:ubiquinone/menaquinone biosynthesis C-methylase UbiE